MGRCLNCGRDSRHEFCETCGEYVGVPVEDVGGEPPLPPPPVLPGAAFPRPPLRRIGAAVARDVRCATCGALGPGGRTFCADCGEEVAGRPPLPQPERVPWWRRAFRPPPAVVTGPIGPLPVRREPTDVRWGVVALVAVPIAAVAAVPLVRSGYRVASERYEPVRPARATGTAIPRYDATRLVDGILNTSWIGPLRPPRGGVAVRVDFPAPVDLDRLGVTQGAREKPDAYAKYQRVERLELVFDDGTKTVVRLADEPAFQSVRVRARGVRWVRMTVVSRYPALSPANGPALSEVEFYRLR